MKAGQITDRNNGLLRARGKAEATITAEYLRRDSCVSGKECDGTLREVGSCIYAGIKQGGTAG